MNRLKLFLISVVILTLASCDARLSMQYTVENNSLKDVKLFIPNFPMDSIPNAFSEIKDTILILKPNTKIIIGVEDKLDFPWATKNIYKKKPGVCGIKKINADTITNIGCSNEEWEYKNGSSNLKIK